MSNIYKLFKENFFFKSVILQILRIFNRLLLTKSVKKYILTEQLQDKKNKKKKIIKKISYVQVKISY